VPEVTAWLGPHLHAVTYPVRGGTLLNVACFVEQPVEGPQQGWDLPGTSERLRAALGAVCDPLQAVVEAAPRWGLWVLHDRTPVAGAHEMARGRIALLGDASHPMRPYLAQGAAMALEDALELGQCLGGVRDRVMDTETALQRYALKRWQRVARVQRRSWRNGQIFHATGPVRLARDLAMGQLGARLMDLPWLYAH
jgi:salicylate hydroxylase